MTKILGISGKKSSGKNSLTNYIVGKIMYEFRTIRNFHLDDQGELYINLQGKEFRLDIIGEKDLFHQLAPNIRVYSFADKLKTDLCMNILGLTYKQCYGADKDKNTITHLKWEDMPGVCTNGRMYEDWILPNGWLQKQIIWHSPGYMTAREVLQFIGTNIFRRIYGNVWVKSTIRQIEKDQPFLAIVYDTRFKNEVDGIHQAGGKVGRLTREVYEDSHMSEIELDRANYNWDNFDFVWKNDTLSIKEQGELVYQAIKNDPYFSS